MAESSAMPYLRRRRPIFTACLLDLPRYDLLRKYLCADTALCEYLEEEAVGNSPIDDMGF